MIDRNTKILICYNEPTKLFTNYLGKEIISYAEDIDTSESELANHISEVISSLQNYYDNIEVLACNQKTESFLSKIKSFSPDVVFNFVEVIGVHPMCFLR